MIATLAEVATYTFLAILMVWRGIRAIGFAIPLHPAEVARVFVMFLRTGTGKVGTSAYE
jgi:hypothetical protein